MINGIKMRRKDNNVVIYHLESDKWEPMFVMPYKELHYAVAQLGTDCNPSYVFKYEDE